MPTPPLQLYKTAKKKQTTTVKPNPIGRSFLTPLLEQEEEMGRYRTLRNVIHDYVIQVALTASFSLTTLIMAMVVLSIGEATYTAINRELECGYREAKDAGLPVWPYFARSAVFVFITRVCESYKLLPPLFGAFFVFKGRSKGWKSSLKWAIGAWLPFLIFQLCLGGWDIFRRVWPAEHSNGYVIKHH